MTSRGYGRHKDSRPVGLWPMRNVNGDEVVGIFTRRSKLNRDGTEGSTRRQKREITKYIVDNEIGVPGPVYSEIVSAYNTKARRDDYENMLADLQAGRIDTIVVWKIDRLCRRVAEWERFIRILRESGGRLISVKDNIDTHGSGMSKVAMNIVLAVIISLAENESENTSARLELWAQERFDQGKTHTGPNRPFGHTRDWKALHTFPYSTVSAHYTVKGGEASLLQDAAKRIVAGETVNAISHDWNARGITTTKGRPWRPEYLKGMLIDPRMVARRTYKGTTRDLAGVPPILGLDVWERVCARLANPYVPRNGTKRLLSAILTCEGCGYHLSGNLSAKGAPRYACRKRAGRPDACGRTGALCAPVDALVASRMVAFLADKDRVTAIMRQVAPGEQFDALLLREAELNAQEIALDTAAFNPPSGTRPLPLDKYDAQMRRIELEREGVKRGLAVNRDAAILAATLSEDWTLELWESKPMDWQRLVIRLCTASVSIASADRIASRDPSTGRNTFDPERIRVRFADE